VAHIGRLVRYIGAGSGVVSFWFMLPMNRWLSMSGGHILIVNWLWSWLMVSVLNRVMVDRLDRMMVSNLNRMMVGRFNMMRVGRFNRLMVG